MELIFVPCSHFRISAVGDTVFLVLRKRPIIFLHWFHHALTFLYMWFSFSYPQAAIRWGVLMNVIVHSIMYTYYAIRAFGIRTPRFVSMSVTVLQILQFLIASYICMLVFRIIVLQGKDQWPGGCEGNYWVSFGHTGMYLLYLYLFIEFFRNAYFTKNGKGE